MTNYSIGDGMVALALAAGIVAWLYFKHDGRRRRLEIIHQERMAAMEKGIPLPEFPLDPSQQQKGPDPTVVPILGTVLLTLSIGSMIVLYLNVADPHRGMWVAPLPFSFLGVGLIAFHFLNGRTGR